MNADWCFTNKDCEACCFSRIVDISSDFVQHEFQCDLRHRIEGQMDTTKKQCGLKENQCYQIERKIATLTNNGKYE